MGMTFDGSPVWVYDVEVFPNYFLFIGYNGEKLIEIDNLDELRKLFPAKNLILAGFNSFDYDDIILRYILNNETCTTYDIYQMSIAIINDQNSNLLFSLKYCEKPWRYSVDIYQLLNAKGSLKEWQCKIGYKTVKECHYPFDKPIDITCISDVKNYCRNDVMSSYEILKSKWDLLVLRKTLQDKFDLADLVYAMSEQAVAQHTFLTIHRKNTGENSQYVREQAALNPDNNTLLMRMDEIIFPEIKFITEPYKEFLDALKCGFIKKDTTWKLEIPSVGDTVKLGGREFAIGVGGLHSVDSPGIFKSDGGMVIIDLDVTSYYPSIIINHNLYPKHMGRGFVDTMRMLRDMRIEAKKAGDKVTSEALKIVINATFGKLDDAYSPIRSAPDAKKVCINGQLFILMLIEKMQQSNFEILSANTDGVTIRLPVEHRRFLDPIIDHWQRTTGFQLEMVVYDRLFRRDVNSYIAITDGGKVKTKGAVNKDSGKADGYIIKEAVELYLLKDIPVDTTIRGCTDIRKFLFYLRSKNGGILHFDGQVVGKSARWYAAIMGGKIQRHTAATAKRKESISIIPHAHSCMLMLDIESSVPSDLDYQYYIDEAKKLIRTIA